MYLFSRRLTVLCVCVCVCVCVCPSLSLFLCPSPPLSLQQIHPAEALVSLRGPTRRSHFDRRTGHSPGYSG
ncbi:MAG: hypothetical protein ACK41O_26620, partial [Runella zeae]